MLVGKPSAAMVKRLEEDEKVRIAKQKEALGPEGLKKMEQELDAAKKEHDKEIPTEILKSFPVPSVKSIAWIPVQSLQEVGTSSGRHRTVEQKDNADLTRHIQSDGPPLPFFVQYDHVEVCSPIRTCLSAVWPHSFVSPTSSRSVHTCRWHRYPMSFGRTS